MNNAMMLAAATAEAAPAAGAFVIQQFLTIGAGFVAVANIGVVFFFISRVNSRSLQNEKDIAESNAKHEKDMAEIGLKFAEINKTNNEHAVAIAVVAEKIARAS